MKKVMVKIPPTPTSHPGAGRDLCGNAGQLHGIPAFAGMTVSRGETEKKESALFLPYAGEGREEGWALSDWIGELGVKLTIAQASPLPSPPPQAGEGIITEGGDEVRLRRRLLHRCHRGRPS